MTRIAIIAVLVIAASTAHATDRPIPQSCMDLAMRHGWSVPTTKRQERALEAKVQFMAFMRDKLAMACRRDAARRNVLEPK